MIIPAKFCQNIIENFGDKGQKWLNSLPDLLVEAKAKWQLSNLVPVTNLSYNYICSGYSNKYNQHIILKLGCEDSEIQTEINALKHYDGHACVKLIDSDNKAMLLEQLAPATCLKSLYPHQENEATIIASNVIRNLHAKTLELNHNFPKVESWLNELNDHNVIVPQHYLIKARLLSTKLISTQDKLVLLHGDLHHENILKNCDKWVAIDPKGIVGEPEYEIGAYLRNPMPELIQIKNAKALIAQRIELFSQLLNLDKQRISDWSYVQAVLSACWGGSHTGYWLEVADIIQEFAS